MMMVFSAQTKFNTHPCSFYNLLLIRNNKSVSLYEELNIVLERVIHIIVVIITYAK